MKCHPQSRVHYRRLLCVMSSWVLNISRDGDFTASVRKLFHPQSKKSGVCFVLCFLKQNFLCFSLGSLPPVFSPDTTEMHLALFSLLTPIIFLYTLMRSTLNLLFSRLKISQLSLSLYKAHSVIFVVPCWVCSSMSRNFLYRGHKTPGVASLVLCRRE